MSLLMGGRNASKIKTQPGTLRFKPDTGYDLSFLYKSSCGPANGWKYTILSESTGEVLVNRYLKGYEGQVKEEKIVPNRSCR